MQLSLISLMPTISSCPCICCQEFLELWRHKRSTDGACNCFFYAEPVRCNCAFCLWAMGDDALIDKPVLM
jgi:hypothetical protein